jgi:threonine synthase
VHKSYASFRNPDITPTIKLRDFWVLELFHGPTMSFNDIGMQFLGNVLEFFLQRGRVQR